MALWWLYCGYVFPVVVKPENLTFYVNFDLEGHDQSHPSPPPKKKKEKRKRKTQTNKKPQKPNQTKKTNKQIQTNKQNSRDPNQGILHLWSKFGDPRMNGLWVIVWTSSKWAKHKTKQTKQTKKTEN